jgi:hypothetical protein
VTYVIIVGCGCLFGGMIDEVPEDRISEERICLVVQSFDFCEAKISPGSSVTQSQIGERNQAVGIVVMECTEYCSSEVMACSDNTVYSLAIQ